MNKYLYFLIIFLRIVFAPLILIWPLQSIIVSFLLDVVDADFACFAISKHQYQIIDKILDTWVYIFELTLALKMFPNWNYFFILLFFWRLVGLIVFYFFKNRKIFLIFGNYFENAFFAFLLKYYFVEINLYYLLLIAFIAKVFQEWFIHVAELSVMEDLFKKKRHWKNN